MTKDEYNQILRVVVKDVRHLLARKMAEAVSSRCEATMLGALRSDGNAVARAAERGIEPVQPRDLWVDPLRPTPMDDRELRRVWDADARRRAISWYGAMAFNPIVNSPDMRVFVNGEDVRNRDVQSIKSYFGQPTREQRFDALRAEGKKLGEINTILEAEGYSEVSGEGVMPCPTKSHEIVRENKGAKRMIERME